MVDDGEMLRIVDAAQTHQGFELQLLGVAQERSDVRDGLRLHPDRRVHVVDEVDNRLSELRLQSIENLLGRHGSSHLRDRLMADLVLKLQDALQERLGARRTARHVDVYRDDPVHTLEDVIAVLPIGPPEVAQHPMEIT